MNHITIEIAVLSLFFVVKNVVYRSQFCKLDLRENAARQRLKMVANTHGTLHEDAIRYTEPRRAEEQGEGEGEGKGEEGVVAALLSLPETSSSLPLVSGREGSVSSDEAMEAQLAEQDTGQGPLQEMCVNMYITLI